MGFIREKEIPPGSGNHYLYEVENHREGSKVVQKHIRYIGRAGGSGGRLGTTARAAPAQPVSTSLTIVPHVEPKPNLSLGTTPKNRELKYVSLPSLDKGEIWATKNEGVFVVVSHRPAQWRGEDADVYGHINTWYTIRPADPEETKLWDEAVNAGKASRVMRDELKVTSGYAYNPNTRELQPSPASTRRLDSYDDRWEPPKSIQLTDAQAAVEERYIQAKAALKTKA